MAQCQALADPQSLWSFCPSLAAACILAVAFLASAATHLIQAIRTHTSYCAIITLATCWQLAGFISRIVSIQNPDDSASYSAWFILILVAPIWTNAFVYMVFGRMVFNFLPRQSLCGIKAWRFGHYFVLLDVIAFLVQASGAGMASGNGVPEDQVLSGLHIYMGGVAFQQLIILVFFLLVLLFRRELAREIPREAHSSAWRLVHVISVVLLLITVRIIFRLIEYANGLNSAIPNQEAYMYCLDTLPMLVASVIFNFYHPGAIMAGKGSDMPGFHRRRVERRRMARLNAQQSSV